MFTYGLDPIAFQVGPIAIRWYSLVWVGGFLLAYWLLKRAAEQRRIKGFTVDDADAITTWLILGTVLGARLVYCFVYNPLYYVQNPLEAVMVWRGGLSFHGGLIGAAIALGWFCKRRGFRFYTIADLLVVPLALALAFGRVANFINGELVGTTTSVPWCVNYPWLEGCRHPSQFYEVGKNLLAFLILLPFWPGLRKPRKTDPGTVFWLFVLLYGFGRLVTNIWRAPDPTDPLFGGLLIGQWLSLIMLIVAAAVLVRREWHRVVPGRKGH